MNVVIAIVILLLVLGAGKTKKRKRNSDDLEWIDRLEELDIGFRIVGELTRCMDREPTHLYQCYYDEAQNEFILRRGILTIVTADGHVF